MNEQVSIFVIDNKEYMVLSKLTKKERTYILLLNQEDPIDFLIQEVKNNELQAISASEFDEVFVEFQRSLGEQSIYASFF